MTFVKWKLRKKCLQSWKKVWRRNAEKLFDCSSAANVLFFPYLASFLLQNLSFLQRKVVHLPSNNTFSVIEGKVRYHSHYFCFTVSAMRFETTIRNLWGKIKNYDQAICHGDQGNVDSTWWVCVFHKNGIGISPLLFYVHIFSFSFEKQDAIASSCRFRSI